MRFTLGIAALAATFAAASPAFAQTGPDPDPAPEPAAITDSANATARGVVLQVHTLTNESDLDFGIVTTDGVSDGTVEIEASVDGTRSVTGGVLGLPSSFHAARFVGLAAPLQDVTLAITNPVGDVLTSAAGDQITVEELTIDAGGYSRATNETGGFTVYVGGRFGLTAAQPVGVYSGLFNLTATYE